MKRVLAVFLLVAAAQSARAFVDDQEIALGNNKYATTPAVGYLLPCSTGMYSITATGRSPVGWWNHGATWNPSEKPKTAGRISWPIASVSITLQGATRTITTTDLPVGEYTGVYPTAKDDPAYAFDHNPNALRAQSLTVPLPAQPQLSQELGCTGNYVAIGLDGAFFASALDSQGRDEPAYEMQDGCGGMSSPWPDGQYHRYRPNDCIPHVNEPAALIGYGLDGFGLYSPYDENGKELRTADLDECHGRTSPVMWDGRLVTMYHYVLTRDYPYTVGCFRGGKAARIPISKPPSAPGMTPPTNAAAPVGALAVTCDAISGWSCDGDAYGNPLTVFFYADGPREGAQAAAGGYIGATSAALAGPASVASACGGGSTHAFSLPLPDALKDGRAHALYGYAADIASDGSASGSFQPLSGSPASVTCQRLVQDAGLRVRDGGQTVPLAAEPAGVSPLKVRGQTQTYDVMLVDPSDANASRVLVTTPLGVKALRRL